MCEQNLFHKNFDFYISIEIYFAENYDHLQYGSKNKIDTKN